jgi:hypothetical protein
VLAFVLVLFLVEETKNLSLEDLDLVFAVSKRRFISFQVQEYIPWFFKRYIFGMNAPEPQLYQDMIWGSHSFRKASSATGGSNALPQRYTPSVGGHSTAKGSAGSTRDPAPMEPIYEPYEAIEMPATPVQARYPA